MQFCHTLSFVELWRTHGISQLENARVRRRFQNAEDPLSWTSGCKNQILRENLEFCKSKVSDNLEMFGGPGRDRTDDLFHAISKGELRRRDTERKRTTRKGSVHAGFRHVRCLLCVTERHRQRHPDTVRDGWVTTQATTQTASEMVCPGPLAGCGLVVQTPPLSMPMTAFCALRTEKFLGKILGELESKVVAEKSR